MAETEMVYTVKEVTAILRCSKNYVYRLINTGQLRCLRLPQIKIRKSTLEAFLEKYEGYDLTDPVNPVLLEIGGICDEEKTN